MKKETNDKQPRLSKHEKKLKEFQEKMEYENLASNYNRARSISVGTAFGGTTEIMVRGDGGRHLWLVMQPVEVVELIHQLASNVGCHLAIKPREDFSSWRDWKVTEQEKLHYNGFAPFINDMAPFHQLGANMEKFEMIKHQEREVLLLQNEIQKNNNNEEFLKIKSFADSLPLEEKIKFLKTKSEEIKAPIHGQSNINLDENNNILNEMVVKDDGSVIMLGGKGGKINLDDAELALNLLNESEKSKQEINETLATEKTVYKRKSKRSSTST